MPTTYENDTEDLIYTSVRRPFDYRWANDKSLCDPGDIVTDFQGGNNTVDLPNDRISPISPYQGLAYRFRADNARTLPTMVVWESIAGEDSNIITPVIGNPLIFLSGLINDQPAVEFSVSREAICPFINTLSLYDMFFVFRLTNQNTSGDAIRFSDAYGGFLTVNFTATAGSGATTTMTITNSAGVFDTFTGKLSDKYYLLGIGQNYWNLFNLRDGSFIAGANGTSGVVEFVNIIFGARAIDIAEMFAYQAGEHFPTQASYSQMFKYLSDRYSTGMIGIPIVFPTPSVPVPNL